MSVTNICGIDPGHKTGFVIITTDWNNPIGILHFETVVGTPKQIAHKILTCFNRLDNHVYTVIERADFRGSHSKTKHGAMINRACCEFIYGALWGARFYDTITKTPMEWKGNTPKTISHARILKVIRSTPRMSTWFGNSKDIDVLPELQPDALDAMGIALAGLKHRNWWE